MNRERVPVVGMTCSEFSIGPTPQPVRFGQNQAYIQAILRAGGAPVLIPQVLDEGALRAIYCQIDALLLSGGVDVHPERYGEPIHEACGEISPGRDEVELRLTRWAVDDDKPVLGICRGIQVLNVAMGGSLYQDIEAQVEGALSHRSLAGQARDRLSHPVEVAERSLLAGITGAGGLRVNSMHHQAVKEVAVGLEVVARAPDGIVEAAEASGHRFVLGVQWHPEELAAGEAKAQQIFDAFVEACRA